MAFLKVEDQLSNIFHQQLRSIESAALIAADYVERYMQRIALQLDIAALSAHMEVSNVCRTFKHTSIVKYYGYLDPLQQCRLIVLAGLCFIGIRRQCLLMDKPGQSHLKFSC